MTTVHRARNVTIIQTGDTVFVQTDDTDDEVTAKWVSTDLRFELTRQVVELDSGDDFPERDVTWGVWDNESDDWAHEPAETGFTRQSDALDAFKAWKTLVG